MKTFQTLAMQHQDRDGGYQVFYIYDGNPPLNRVVSDFTGVVAVVTVYDNGNKTYEFDSDKIYTHEEVVAILQQCAEGN